MSAGYSLNKLTVDPFVSHAHIAHSLVRRPIVLLRQSGIDHVVEVSIMRENNVTAVIEQEAFRSGIGSS